MTRLQTRLEKRRKYNIWTRVYVALGVIPGIFCGLLMPSFLEMCEESTTLSEGFALMVQHNNAKTFVIFHTTFALAFGFLFGALVHAHRNRISGPAYD